VCYQFFWRKGLEGKLPFVPQKIGGWWKANQEVDLVLLCEDQLVMVECKWSKRPVGTDIFQNLESKNKDVLHDARQRATLYALCSRSGFTDNMVMLARERGDIQIYAWENMV